MQEQYLILALAVTFAVALSLTIALLAVAAKRADGGFAQESAGTDSESGSCGTIPEPATTEAVLAGDTELTLANGLTFASFGNGTCTVTGIGDCAESCIVIPDRASNGDLVVAIAPRAFFGCDSIRAVRIPAEITEIGELAFGNCPSLVYLSVSPKNPCYTDREGVLYTADGASLILYPPARTGATVEIAETVKSIREMAFYGCTYLQNVVYLGSESAWGTVSVSPGNHSLHACSLTFRDLRAG